MKTKLYLLFFFVFPLFMSACRGDDPIPDPPVDGKRTVLVYMAADNSINPLASFTDGDLEELKAGMASIDNTSDMHLYYIKLRIKSEIWKSWAKILIGRRFRQYPQKV